MELKDKIACLRRHFSEDPDLPMDEEEALDFYGFKVLYLKDLEFRNWIREALLSYEQVVINNALGTH